MHLNLWKLDGTPAADQEVVFDSFTFVPAGGIAPVDTELDDTIPGAPAGRLYPASPNPFNPQTTVRFDLARSGFAVLDVYDVNGRHVRTLASGYLTAGEHRATWDGRDDQDRLLAAGVYLVRLRGSDFVAAQRVALIK